MAQSSEQVAGLSLCCHDAQECGNVESAASSAALPAPHPPRVSAFLPGEAAACHHPRCPSCWSLAPQDRSGLQGSPSDWVLQMGASGTQGGCVLPGLERAESLCAFSVTESHLRHLLLGRAEMHVTTSGYLKFQDPARVVRLDRACGKRLWS